MRFLLLSVLLVFCALSSFSQEPAILGEDNIIIQNVETELELINLPKNINVGFVVLKVQEPFNSLSLLKPPTLLLKNLEALILNIILNQLLKQ